MTDVEIETGIPMPGPKKGGRIPSYPWLLLNVGDSFFVSGKKGGHFGSHMKAYSPRRFVTRTAIKNGVKGIRVWRIE